MKSMRRYTGALRKQAMAVYQHWLGIPMARFLASYRRADIAIFFEFKPAPYGGGNQFMTALSDEFERRGLRLENNAISHTTRACLFNSYNFDFHRLRALNREGCYMVHRVDGPLGVYRGHDDGSDARIWQINHELADATIFQSNYSLQKHLELGMEFVSPSVILNTCDSKIFHSDGRVEFDPARKLRLISTSWSPNPNKGALVYKWIEEHLDWRRFDYTFVGNSPIQFERISMIPPQTSHQLAKILRQHDIFITATKHDSCSNALLEALSCGLPALYLLSGGSPEIVGHAGISFQENSQILEGLDQLVSEYLDRQAMISLPSLSDVANKYLKVMGIES